ncbi:hypothetical protein [Rhodoferax bucti]|uniref:hypothetical protein n=1 Tax=Rhodoferax bucti TaxID=2576305 RepID=UPI0011094326|nr:hypothetical protein [Rhodoferax bucti]
MDQYSQLHRSGTATPIKENALDTQGIKGAKTIAVSAAEFATRPLPSKEENTLIAQMALAGHAVHRGKNGGFTACKYGMTRYCEDFAALKRFATQLGVINGL